MICLLSALSLFQLTSPALAGQKPDTSFDWAVIGDPGNVPIPDDLGGFRTEGRGSVSYEFRMSKTEVSTGQWLDFVNTFSTQSDDLELFGAPIVWGASVDPTYDGPGRRWRLLDDPDAATRPVYGISWRTAAMYANWLHNDMGTSLDAISDGAYDTSTFGTNPDGSFTDQATHHPDAKYWIPTLDEWLKAAHYDPDRFGEGEGGWWRYSHQSDVPPIPGAPGEGQTSGGYDPGGFTNPELEILLGAYPETTSPWGLLDMSGAGREWTEEIVEGREFRLMHGSYAGDPFYEISDSVEFVVFETPSIRSLNSIRLASVIPSPNTGICLFVPIYSVFLARRRSS